MRSAIDIARRDLAAMFMTPTGWVVLGAWGLIASLVFSLMTLLEGEPATLRAVIVVAGWSAAILAPAISMRAFAEEGRLGTMELLLSSPISATSLVVGKVAACVGMLVVLGLPVLVLAGVAELYGRVDPGELLSGLLGLLLIGTAMASLGVLVSSRTTSQVVAYLVTFFACFALVLVVKGVPGLLPQVLPASANASWIETIRSVDPLLRLDSFALGLFDTANIVWFVAVVAFFMLTAIVSLLAPRWPRAVGLGGRLGRLVSTGVFLLGGAVIAVSLVVVFSSPSVRIKSDFTKTRAYSLTPATVALLETLDGSWSVHLLVSGDQTDVVTLRHVDEVLERMGAVNDSFSAERIDPSDPTAMLQYEALLERLVAQEQGTIDEWMAAIDQGLDAFEALRSVGGVLARSARDTVGSLESSQSSEFITRVGETLGTVSEQGGTFREYLEEALQTSLAQPLPDWELVKSSLVANNGLYASEFEQLADVLLQWSTDTSLDEGVQAFATTHLATVEATAVALRKSVDALNRLEQLEVARVGVAVAEGDVAIVSGPNGFLIVPPWQLFPPTAVTRESGSVIGFDRRFRGEEVLASAIRALEKGVMPHIVFVHAEERSMLRSRDDGMDVYAVAEAMRTARMTVEEWTPSQHSRPAPQASGAPTVWVVLPPLRRTGIAYQESEHTLIEATRSLLADGEAVLLTPARSLLPLVGQRDPWATMLEAFGVEIQTGKVVYEFVPASTSEEDAGVLSVQYVNHPAPAAGVLGAALQGKRLFLNHPTPVVLAAVSETNATIVAAIEPNILRFLEDDWRGDGSNIRVLPEEKRFAESQPIVVAIERGEQRAIVVGSGGWLLSAIVNDSGTLGGNRVVLLNPGNRELALSGVAWLAGMDELIATASSGGEVARFQGITPQGRLVWGLVLPLFLGVGPLVVGSIVGSIRRRGA